MNGRAMMALGWLSGFTSCLVILAFMQSNRHMASIVHKPTHRYPWEKVPEKPLKAECERALAFLREYMREGGIDPRNSSERWVIEFFQVRHGFGSWYKKPLNVLEKTLIDWYEEEPLVIPAG